MKPYDPEAKCPKCGHAEVETHYEDKANLCPWEHRNKAGNEVEHLDRYCKRCSYAWAEGIPKGRIPSGQGD